MHKTATFIINGARLVEFDLLGEVDCEDNGVGLVMTFNIFTVQVDIF